MTVTRFNFRLISWFSILRLEGPGIGEVAVAHHDCRLNASVRIGQSFAVVSEEVRVLTSSRAGVKGYRVRNRICRTSSLPKFSVPSRCIPNFQ